MSTAEHDNTSMLIAWDLLKLKLAPEKWTVSDHFNSQGFFAWGWEARKQYDIPMQTRITELEAENERLIKVSLFKENVAGVLRAQLADAKKDAERYQWLCDKGYNYHGAMAGTGSMSICRGPYILLEPPSHNNFSKMVLGKAAADVIIDAAIQAEGKQA